MACMVARSGVSPAFIREEGVSCVRDNEVHRIAEAHRQSHKWGQMWGTTVKDHDRKTADEQDRNGDGDDRNKKREAGL